MATLKIMPARTGTVESATRAFADSRNSRPMPKPMFLPSLSARCPCPSSCRRLYDYVKRRQSQSSNSLVTAGSRPADFDMSSRYQRELMSTAFIGTSMRRSAVPQRCPRCYMLATIL